MRPTLDQALSNRLQGAVDEGWLHICDQQCDTPSASIEDLVVVVKSALADTFGWLLAEGFSSLLVVLFRMRANDDVADDADMHAELLRCLEDALGVTRLIEAGVSA